MFLPLQCGSKILYVSKKPASDWTLEIFPQGCWNNFLTCVHPFKVCPFTKYFLIGKLRTFFLTFLVFFLKGGVTSGSTWRLQVLLPAIFGLTMELMAQYLGLVVMGTVKARSSVGWWLCSTGNGTWDLCMQGICSISLNQLPGLSASLFCFYLPFYW